MKGKSNCPALTEKKGHGCKPFEQEGNESAPWSRCLPSGRHIRFKTVIIYEGNAKLHSKRVEPRKPGLSSLVRRQAFIL